MDLLINHYYYYYYYHYCDHIKARKGVLSLSPLHMVGNDNQLTAIETLNICQNQILTTSEELLLCFFFLKCQVFLEGNEGENTAHVSKPN